MIKNGSIKDIESKDDGIVIIDFWAPWCGPCKSLALILDDVVNEFGVSVLKINIDEEKEAAKQFQIRGIPTLLIKKNGTITDRKIGALSKSQLLDWIKTHQN